MPPRPRTFGRFLLLFTVIVWGWTFVATKICLGYLTPEELLGLRLLIAIPILCAVLLFKRIPLKFERAEYTRLLAASAIFAAHFLVQIHGLRFTSATNTGWILASSPLVLAVLSMVFLKERLGARELTGIVAATMGILLLVSKGRLTDLRWLTSAGDWLVLASAHTWAVYTVVTRDISRARHPLAVTTGILLPVGLAMTGYMVFTSDWTKFLHLPPRPLIALLFLGIIGMAAGQWFWQEGLARVGAARAGIFLYLEPLATTALAVPLLGETFGVFTALGGLLVLGGVFWAQRSGQNKGA